MTQDELFMQRAMELARLGAGLVSPNPLVGCVIVHEDKIIGEGWHRRYGESHAEVNAVAAVKEKSLLPSATAYVNLEPCSHYGKTPPCVDLLLSIKIKRVVISNMDSNPLVAGTGIKKLKEAGTEVSVGVLENEGRFLNRRFFTFMEKQRPFIVLKWAQTKDGFIAPENFEFKWISNIYSQQLVHVWRAEEDAVFVGTNTAMYDNPRLNVRVWSGKNPVRLVVDKSLRLDKALNIFDGSQPTIIYNTQLEEQKSNLLFVRLEEKKFWEAMVKDIYDRGIESILVEGGAKVLEQFIQNGWWDEARIFTAPANFVKGIIAPSIRGVTVSDEKILDDTLTVLLPEKIT